jgi:hypothetical protein
MNQIDTTVIYEEYENNYYEGFVKQDDKLARHNYTNPNKIYSVYRFYGNGNFNEFHLDRDDSILTKQFFDPSYAGWRGILYKKKGEILGDMFTQVGQLSSQLGISTSEFTFKGDTLFVERKNLNKYVFIKRKINKELLDFNANW